MMPTGSESRVFIVDDDEELRESLSWLFESAGLHVESYATAQEFLIAYKPGDPGCLLIDVRMPGLSGLELQDELRRRGVSPPIIMMTGYAKVPMAVQALKGGALDFIQKPFSDQALLERVREAIELDRRTRGVRMECAAFVSRVGHLTPREGEVMKLMVAGKPNKIIASDLGISSKTVEIHRGRVMEKTRVSSLAELVRLELLSRDDSVEIDG